MADVPISETEWLLMLVQCWRRGHRLEHPIRYEGTNAMGVSKSSRLDRNALCIIRAGIPEEVIAEWRGNVLDAMQPTREQVKRWLEAHP